MITNILANTHATVILYYLLESPNLAFSYSKLKNQTNFSNNILYSALNTLKSYSILTQKNKKYILNFDNEKTHVIIDILKKDKSKFKFITTQNYLKIRNIVKFLENKKIKKAYLFGSIARGTARIDSDIDIAIIADKNIDIYDWQLYFNNLNINVEFHYFAKLDKNKSLDQKVLEEGILLIRKSL